MTDDQERFPLWTPPQPIKLPGTGAIDYCVANDGSQRPKGTRRRSQRDSRYVTTCQEGALGQVDWIESRSPAVTTTVRSPQSGTLDSKGDNGNISSVGAVLTVEVSWGQEFQEATVRYDAECWFWDAVMWHREGEGLSEEFKPVIDGTITLSQDLNVLQSHAFHTGTGSDSYLCTVTRTYTNLQPGTYQVEITGTKTKGRRTTDGKTRTGKDRVVLQKHTATFTIG